MWRCDSKIKRHCKSENLRPISKVCHILSYVVSETVTCRFQGSGGVPHVGKNPKGVVVVVFESWVNRHFVSAFINCILSCTTDVDGRMSYEILLKTSIKTANIDGAQQDHLYTTLCTNVTVQFTNKHDNQNQIFIWLYLNKLRKCASDTSLKHKDHTIVLVLYNECKI